MSESAALASYRRARTRLRLAVGGFRSYLLPAHIWSYWNLMRQGAGQADIKGRKLVCFDFTRVEIDFAGGRYLFGLVRDFEALGYLPCYRKNFSFLASLGRIRHKRRLLEHPFHIYKSVDELPADSIAAVLTDRFPPTENPGRRQIRVRYDATWPQSDQEVPMTFFVHPALYDQWLACPPPDLAAPRSWRVFFSGRALDYEYGRDVLPKKFGKMSRRQILETLAAALPPESLRQIETEADLQPGAPYPGFVWSNLTGYRIPRKDWLDVLARADFFLACPGMDMPLCHNLIEALSRGAVPILEHPEFLDPPLEPDVNCLAFHGRDELIRTFERAFQFNPEQIIRLRQGAYAYYRKHLAVGAFARRLLDSPHSRVDLLWNAYRTPGRSQ